MGQYATTGSAQFSPLPGSTAAWIFFRGLSGAVILPNPRRTLKPVVTGYAGRDFLPLTPDDSEGFTFNMVSLLAGGRLIQAMSVTVEAADALSASLDGSPMTRLIAGPAIDSCARQVSFRLGNFLSLPDIVTYRLTARVQDNGSNAFESFADVQVIPRDDPAWEV